MSPLLQQALTSVMASGPVATVLLVMWYYQRKDAKEQKVADAAALKSEQDRHSAEEDKWRDKYGDLVQQLVAFLKGDPPHG